MIVRLTRRYGFYAAHRLHSPFLSDAENDITFGKCNNPHGHGHNYEVELTVCGPAGAGTGVVVNRSALDAVAEREILAPLRFRNLNEEVPAFRSGVVPTTENLAIEIDRRLRAAWLLAFPDGHPRLEKVRIRETARNICDIYG